VPPLSPPSSSLPPHSSPLLIKDPRLHFQTIHHHSLASALSFHLMQNLSRSWVAMAPSSHNGMLILSNWIQSNLFISLSWLCILLRLWKSLLASFFSTLPPSQPPASFCTVLARPSLTTTSCNEGPESLAPAQSAPLKNFASNSKLCEQTAGA
jgi:hypothetical protein